MKVKLKSTLVLLATLIIGIVIGSVLTSRFMRSHSSDRWKHLRSADGFIERFYERLDIRPEQKTSVEPILQDYFSKMKENSQNFRQHFRQVQDSLHAQLIPLLDEDQKNRLKRFTRRKKKGPDPEEPPPAVE